MKYRKVGGLHWLNIGRIRIMWCVMKPKHTSKHPKLPHAKTLVEIMEQNAQHSVTHDFTTWNPDERNHFIF